MLEFAMDTNNNCVIASVLHLPSNIMVKHSSQTEEKAFALCISDINEKIKELTWLTTKDKNEDIEQINFNGLISVQSQSLTQANFQTWLDSTIKYIPTIHRFKFENSIYTSYCFNEKINTRKILESLFLIKNVDFQFC